MDEEKNKDEESFGRQMVQGDWECSKCGTKITELPFEPRGDQPLYCKDCYEKPERRSGGGRSFDRQMVQGDWECAKCGTKVTELPFQPSEGRPVYCKDCYRSERP